MPGRSERAIVLWKVHRRRDQCLLVAALAANGARPLCPYYKAGLSTGITEASYASRRDLRKRAKNAAAVRSPAGSAVVRPLLIFVTSFIVRNPRLVTGNWYIGLSTHAPTDCLLSRGSSRCRFGGARPGPGQIQRADRVRHQGRAADLWNEALYRWQKATELDPTYAAAWNNLAIAYEHEGKFEEAKKAYEKALQLDPKNLMIRQNYDLFKEINDRTKRRAGK